jgi:hypothetical protein
MIEGNIDSIVKALGTMIEVPQWEKEDPSNIASKKIIVGVYREGILVGKHRERVQEKLVELIESIQLY